MYKTETRRKGRSKSLNIHMETSGYHSFLQKKYAPKRRNPKLKKRISEMATKEFLLCK
jgi:hypothetical protein